MIRLNIKDETSTLQSVILGIANSSGRIPSPEEAYDPKSLEHILAGTYPQEADLIEEMSALARIFEKYQVTLFRPNVLKDCNQIFSRDIAFVIEDRLYVSNILPDRDKEIKAIQEVLDQIDPTKIIFPPEDVHVEGGDVIPWGDHIFIGTYTADDYPQYITARTNQAAVDFIRSEFPNKTVKAFELKKSNTDPRNSALHLDCCFQPIGKGKAIICKNGFLVESEYEWLVNFFGKENTFEVTQEEMYEMQCNVFSISTDVIISEQKFIRLNQWLIDQGFTVEEVPYAEVSKQGGLLRCSTLPLERADTNESNITSQTTDTILMIRMATIRSNEETAQNNYYQKDLKISEAELLKKAQKEFDSFVSKLRDHDINIVVVDGDEALDTPDAHFPNNWISCHSDGTMVLYPMYAPSRRRERRDEVIDTLSQKFKVSRIINYSDYESHDIFLEGTGSLIIDHQAKKAYCGLSARADEDLLNKYCNDLGFTPITFTAYQSVESRRLPIYHTNVMMALGDRYAVICLDSIDDADERRMVINSLEEDNKEIIEISEEQVVQFAGNMLQVNNKDGEHFLVMSTSAHDSLTDDQKKRILNYNKIIHSDLTLIETVGGGSARCMMAEVFLPKK